MLISKTKEAHKELQSQFINRTIKKYYLAQLNGNVKDETGIINLPLRGDPDNRPHQLVCHEYGKAATTKYKVLERKDHKTLVEFEPITGRTHQLRIHSAHQDGLGVAIVGDDLYGKKDQRLHLHASKIIWSHPVTKKQITAVCNIRF
jgi:tRNA pseudouridine32 synthase/23S rRNA pseudouridine746 synthase